MYSKRTLQKEVIEMHKGIPHIRTEIVILTPIEEDVLDKFKELMLHGVMDQVIDQMHSKVEDDIAETFEADIESINVSLKHCY